ncbi:MAG: hypothetical protein ACLT16_20575 [[Clostridium] innocuum]
MNSMFLIFYLILNTIGGYLFVEAAPEAYPDIAKSVRIRISESGELRDGTFGYHFKGIIRLPPRVFCW